MWTHASTPARIRPLRDLGSRIIAQRPDLTQLITVGQGQVPTEHRDNVITTAMASDHPAAARSFLDYWRPDLCLWAGAGWMPNLITGALERKMPMILADLTVADMTLRKRWVPDLTRTCIDSFQAVYAGNADSAAYIKRLGVPSRKVITSTPLRPDANPETCSETVLAKATGDLAGRPLWLAANVTADEFDLILSAHREALRFQHRLLLMISPTDNNSCVTLASQLQRSNLAYDKWEPHDPVSPETQVLIIEQEHLGLWYRLSPLTFMGESLFTGATGSDPLEATALGSAILYGPNVSAHENTYIRLSREGGARIVRSSAGLAASVVDLVSPEKAAKMALAGWKVVTESAELMDRLSDQIQDELDDLEFADARA